MIVGTNLTTAEIKKNSGKINIEAQSSAGFRRKASPIQKQATIAAPTPRQTNPYPQPETPWGSACDSPIINFPFLSKYYK